MVVSCRQSSQNPVYGKKYILRYADHLSAYGNVRPMQGRSSAPTARAVNYFAICDAYQIADRQLHWRVSMLICLIERGNITFKDALQNLMRENKTVDWSIRCFIVHNQMSIGCFIVHNQMNRRASKPQNNTVLYEIYFGMATVSEVEKTLGEPASHVRTEVGLQLIKGVLLQLKKTHPMLHLSNKKILEIIEQGNAPYNAEAQLPALEEKEALNFDAKLSDLLKTVVSELPDDAVMKCYAAMKKLAAMKKRAGMTNSKKNKMMKLVHMIEEAENSNSGSSEDEGQKKSESQGGFESSSN